MTEEEEAFAEDISYLVSEALCRFKADEVHSEDAFWSVATLIVSSGPIKALLEIQSQFERLCELVSEAESAVMKAERSPLLPTT